MVHGRSGNRSAIFPLEASGINVDPLNTCQYSTHTAYPHLRGPVLTQADFLTILEGLQLNDIMPLYTHLLTGYLADPSISNEIAKLRAQLGPHVEYFCDPVLGDWGKTYVPDDSLEFTKRTLLPIADVITPNSYEAMWITGRTIKNPSELFTIIDDLHSIGPRHVVLTSTEWDHRLVFFSWDNGKTQFGIETPWLPREFDGPGDIFTALLLANCIKFPGEYEKIAERTVNSVFAILDKTHQLGAREIELPAAVMAIVEPPTVLKVISRERIEAMQVEDHTLPLDPGDSYRAP
jgi:pyridoxine kinase